MVKSNIYIFGGRQRIATGVDHLVMAVRDLASARQVYEMLGFTVTPRAEHPFGTSNHIIQLDDNFMELVGVERLSLIHI